MTPPEAPRPTIIASVCSVICFLPLYPPGSSEFVLGGGPQGSAQGFVLHRNPVASARQSSPIVLRESQPASIRPHHDYPRRQDRRTFLELRARGLLQRTWQETC